MHERLICSLQELCKVLRQSSEANRCHCNMRRSLSEVFVRGRGLLTCYLLSVMIPLKSFCMEQKDDLVFELASIYVFLFVLQTSE